MREQVSELQSAVCACKFVSMNISKKTFVSSGGDEAVTVLCTFHPHVAYAQQTSRPLAT